MFSLSHQYVEAYQSDLRKAAAAERLANETAERRRGRLAATVKSVWSLLSGPAETPVTPTLSDYPFRATHAAAR